MQDTNEVANRLLVIASWLMAFSMFLLTFTIQNIAANPVPETIITVKEYVLEGIPLIFTITSLVLYTTAASCLISPHYEGASNIDTIKILIFGRRLLVVGTVLVFISLSVSIISAMHSHPRSYFYAGVCFVAPFIWLYLRKTIAKTPF